MAILSKYYGITGAELRAERKAAGLSQTTPAERALIGRHAVIYWEKKPGKFWRGWAIQRMFEALGLTVLSVYSTPMRARMGSYAGSIGRAQKKKHFDRCTVNGQCACCIVGTTTHVPLDGLEHANADSCQAVGAVEPHRPPWPKAIS